VSIVFLTNAEIKNILLKGPKTRGTMKGNDEISLGKKDR
jgi:hypothetical protein